MISVIDYKAGLRKSAGDLIEVGKDRPWSLFLALKADIRHHLYQFKLYYNFNESDYMQRSWKIQEINFVELVVLELEQLGLHGLVNVEIRRDFEDL